jgi:hypothetical protein
MRNLYLGGFVMDFIRTFFNLRIGANVWLIDYTLAVWRECLWLEAIKWTLLTLFSIVIGLLILPIDIIVVAILWNVTPLMRDTMKEDEEKFGLIPRT